MSESRKPSADMMLSELVALIKKANRTAEDAFALRINRSGTVDVWSCDSAGTDRDLYEVSMDEVIAHLRKLATPSKPATVTIEVPYEYAHWLVNTTGPANRPIYAESQLIQ